MHTKDLTHDSWVHGATYCPVNTCGPLPNKYLACKVIACMGTSMKAESCSTAPIESSMSLHYKSCIHWRVYHDHRATLRLEKRLELNWVNIFEIKESVMRT